MDHVGNRIPDRTGDQQRRPGLFGGSAAHVIGCLRTLLIHLPRRIAGLLINFGRRISAALAMPSLSSVTLLARSSLRLSLIRVPRCRFPMTPRHPAVNADTAKTLRARTKALKLAGVGTAVLNSPSRPGQPWNWYARNLPKGCILKLTGSPLAGSGRLWTRIGLAKKMAEVA
jgi:hypothetical protein